MMGWERWLRYVGIFIVVAAYLPEGTFRWRPFGRHKQAAVLVGLAFLLIGLLLDGGGLRNGGGLEL
jgi:hypothetical protein